MKLPDLARLSLRCEAALQRSLFQAELARTRDELSPLETSFNLAVDGARLIRSMCEHEPAEWKQPGPESDIGPHLLACLPEAIALLRALRKPKS
jgi:hypothetical protein